MKLFWGSERTRQTVCAASMTLFVIAIHKTVLVLFSSTPLTSSHLLSFPHNSALISYAVSVPLC